MEEEEELEKQKKGGETQGGYSSQKQQSKAFLYKKLPMSRFTRENVLVILTVSSFCETPVFISFFLYCCISVSTNTSFCFSKNATYIVSVINCTYLSYLISSCLQLEFLLMRGDQERCVFHQKSIPWSCVECWVGFCFSAGKNASKSTHDQKTALLLE